MNISQLSSYILYLKLALNRYGWINSVIGLAFFGGLLLWIWAIPMMHENLKVQEQRWLNKQRDLLNTGKDASDSRPNTTEANLKLFTSILGDPYNAEEQIKTLFMLARNTGLTLSKAEYKLTDVKSGRYATYQIVLPVKGSYRSIRQFCEKTLLSIPFASLDEMSFKRESIASGTLEARLRFTLYLSESSLGNLFDARQSNFTTGDRS